MTGYEKPDLEKMAKQLHELEKKVEELSKFKEDLLPQLLVALNRLGQPNLVLDRPPVVPGYKLPRG